MPGHPLGDHQGHVYVHRLVLFEKVGPGSHLCRWCRRSVEWRARTFGKPMDSVLVVDHLDGDRLNNDPSNLAVSCQSCNARRHEQEAA